MNDPIDVLGALLVCCLVLGVYDVTCSSKHARWFSVHAFGNLLAAALSIPAMIQWFTDPVTSMNEVKYPTPRSLSLDGIIAVNSLWPTHLIVAQHIYHLVAFRDVRAGDVWHHLAFVPVIGVYGGLICEWGPLRNCLGFFISGLPGGIDYVGLVLHKSGTLSKMAQRQLGLIMALCIRAPGLLLVAFTMYMSKVYSETLAGWGPLALMMVFSVTNALYYLQQVIGAYYVFCLKEKEKAVATRASTAAVATVCPPRSRRHLPS